jgi:Mannosyl-glycoprotein endo-beta-N-acetylglucosaminidase
VTAKAFALAVGLLGTLLVAPWNPAAASTAAPAPPDAAAAQAAIDLSETAVEFTTITHDLADAEVAVGTTQASLNVTVGELTVNGQQLDSVKQRVRERGVAAYQHSAAGSVAPLDVGRVQDLDTARRYAASAAVVDTSDLARLDDIQAKLERERADKAELHDDVVAKRDELQQRHDVLGAARARQQAVLDRIGAVPVMGDAELTAGQLAAWFRSTGAVPRLVPGTTIDDVAALYIDEGADEGVRGDFAFAQAIIETGSFGVAAGNNFSGIGVCDSCTGGYGFATPRDGIRAQIQLLRNYADPHSRAAALAHPPAPGLYGADGEKAAHLYDTFFLKGKAPLWNLMGNGNWATDPTYAPKVVGVFNQMVAFANAHPEVA